MGRGHRPVKVIIPHISQDVIHDRHDSPDILVSYIYPHNIAKRQIDEAVQNGNAALLVCLLILTAGCSQGDKG